MNGVVALGEPSPKLAKWTLQQTRPAESMAEGIWQAITKFIEIEDKLEIDDDTLSDDQKRQLRNYLFGERFAPIVQFFARKERTKSTKENILETVIMMLSDKYGYDTPKKDISKHQEVLFKVDESLELNPHNTRPRISVLLDLLGIQSE